MRLYNVRIAGTQAWTKPVLTYSSDEKINIGTVVLVPFGKKEFHGIVVSETTGVVKNVRPIAQKYSENTLPLQTLKLLDWLEQYYVVTGSPVTKLFIPSFLGKKILGEDRTTNGTNTLGKLHRLTTDQKKATEIIQKNNTVILHGDTATGKTRVYMDAIENSLNTGKNALVLCPEIILTSVIHKNLAEVFGPRCLVIHSGLSNKERRLIWGKILVGAEPYVVVGPRSALFLPFVNLGVVVVDEEHEPAYRQDEQPCYDSVRVASKLAELYFSKLILGSATPSIIDYFYAQQKNIPIVPMTQIATIPKAKFSSSVEVIDMKNRINFSSSYYLSDKLMSTIKTSLIGNKQCLIYLNKRGTARVVACMKCGWQALCPNCNKHLIYHQDKNILKCHTCGHQAKAPTICPECNNPDLLYKGIGTKAVVDILEQKFPHARIGRFDTDSERKNIGLLTSDEIDIIVGTQQIAKGIDLPRLEMIGIIFANEQFTIPDFSSVERSFQLLYQVMGRVARGHGDSKIVIQTPNPESPIIKFAISRDWPGFYKSELEARKKYNFPPFTHILKIVIKRKTDKLAETSLKALINSMAWPNGVSVTDPSPSLFLKSNGVFSWQIIVRSKERSKLVDIAEKLPLNCIFELDAQDLL